MKKFNCRLYQSFGDFAADMRTVMSQRENIRGMMRGLDPAFRERLLEAYGEETVAHIDLALRMIRIGNLTGNCSITSSFACRSGCSM